MAWTWVSTASCVFFVLLLGYLFRVNSVLTRLHPEWTKFCVKPWTREEVLEAFEKCKTNPPSLKETLPPRLGRRYIVCGGSGMVGGWIVQHLLERGESPAAIRIVDLQPPTRPAVIKAKVQYIRADVTESTSLSEAFGAAWSSNVAKLPLTVFHTVAFINAADRKAEFLTPYLKVNVEGTRNVLAAAKAAGCSAFIATSSSSISIKRTGHFFWPWQRYPRNWLQVSDNAEPTAGLDAPLESFFGCYGYSKARAEKLVREADDKSAGFRTGVIRPGHAVYGHGDENIMSISYDYLRRGGTPTWVYPMILHFVCAANVSLAHLLFESRLVGNKHDKTVDIGGNAYFVTDPNPPLVYESLYFVLSTLAHPAYAVAFPHIPAVPMLLLSYLIEAYVVVQHRYCHFFLPKLTGDLAMIQPGLLNVSTCNLIYDISRARRDLGYDSPLTTLEGLCLQVKEWNERVEVALKGGRQPLGIKKAIKPVEGTEVTNVLPVVPKAVGQ